MFPCPKRRPGATIAPDGLPTRLYAPGVAEGASGHSPDHPPGRVNLVTKWRRIGHEHSSSSMARVSARCSPTACLRVGLRRPNPAVWWLFLFRCCGGEG